MRILFIGAVAFSARALKELINMDADLVGVCTLESSSFNADHFDLTPIANAAAIPVRYTPDINSEENLAWILECSPDVIFCFGWSRLIKKPLLQLAPIGVVGFHPAALPSNRGRHPLIWALILGLTETASSFFFMDQGADSGDILSQVPVPISKSDDASSLYDRVTKIAMEQIRIFLPKLETGTHQRQPQDHATANIWRKRSFSDGQIDWRMAAQSIHNLVRGLSHPYVGAHFLWQGLEVLLWRTEIVELVPSNIEPGKVVRVDEEGPVVKAGVDAIRFLDYVPKISLSAGDYL